MAKRKLSTPVWIMEGFDSEADYNKKKGIKEEKKVGKTFKIRECPECGSDEVEIVLSGSDAEEGGGDNWKCNKCKWKGPDIVEKELTEDELMKYMDKRGEEVA